MSRRRVRCRRDADAFADLLPNMSLSREHKWEAVDRELTQIRDRKQADEGGDQGDGYLSDGLYTLMAPS